MSSYQAKQAGKAKQAYEAEIKQAAQKAQAQEAAAQAALTSGKTEAQAAYAKGGAQGTAALNKAEQQGIGTLESKLGAGTKALGLGLQGAVDQYGHAINLWNPLYNAANQGMGIYSDFMGLNGPEGFARATGIWQGSPLYNAMVGASSLGQQALDRQAAARGNPYNATDVLQYQGQLADQYLNQFLQGYDPYFTQGQNAATAMSNIYGNEANAITGTGQNIANLAAGAGQNEANLYGQTGANLSSVATGTAGRIGNAAETAAGTSANLSNDAAARRDTEGQLLATNAGGLYANKAAANAQSQANQQAMYAALINAAGKVGGAYAGNTSAFA